MFKIFPGFNLLEKIQKDKSHKRERKLPVTALKLILIIATTLVVALIPTTTFQEMGLTGLTVVQHRVIAMFVFAALMWLTEALPSWVTSMVVVVVMLLTVSNSAFTNHN